MAGAMTGYNCAMSFRILSGQLRAKYFRMKEPGGYYVATVWHRNKIILFDGGSHNNTGMSCSLSRPLHHADY
jgi:hypothetical protein